ncbi:MAG TPA: IS4 family transposase, partial [Anaerolineales bacterium]|nr:IS4 family transposase [Anaerolineales bacterium]
IAKLGGFLARKGDGPPGVQTIWRGLNRLSDIAATWRLLHPSDVGNG